MQFGFTPRWAKKQFYTLNARSESDSNPDDDPGYAGAMGMNLRVGATWGTEQPYDGTLPGLGVYTDAPYPQEIRNWHLWDAANQALVDNAFLEINPV